MVAAEKFEEARAPEKEKSIRTALPHVHETLAAEADTLPKRFLLRVAEFGDRVAMRKKRYGIWQEFRWSDSYRRVHDFCLGLVSLGLRRGETVAIIGENDPEFYWGQIAAWSAGARTTAIFTDANLQELEYILTHSDAVFLLAHDQEQCDKALDLREKLPGIRKVIYWEARGLWNYNDAWLASFADIEARGRDHARQNPGAFEALVRAGEADDVAILSYTSGTTSLPKGAMISHANLIYGNLHASLAHPTHPADNYVSFSPLAWITEQSLGVTGHLSHGFQVNFPEGPETVAQDLREIAPSTLLFPSRIWENIVSTIQVRMNDSFWINRRLFDVFLPVAYRLIDMEDAGRAIPPHWRLLRWLGEVAVFQPLRDKIGLTRIRNAFSSGAALSPDQLRFLRALGIELKNLYGSTEMQTATVHHDGDIKLATVGRPPPGVEVKISAAGEILVRSRAVFQGYHKAPQESAAVLDADGWFHSGDGGHIDADGHLIYLDRLKDMIRLKNGERFSPQYIEGRLKFSPYIQDVMAVGGADVDFVTAIINIDFENVSRWAEKSRVSFTTLVDLSQKAQVQGLIKQDVQRVNETLPPAARIRKFVVLHKAFDADEGELTRTRKLRRAALQEKYGQMLDAMYNNLEQVSVSAEVKYRDGRSGMVETAIRVCMV